MKKFSFKLFTIEIRGQKISTDEEVLEILGAKYPSEIYAKQVLRTLKTHFRNFVIIDYDLKTITMGFEFEPTSLISMINWQVGTFVERKTEGIFTLRFNTLSNLRDAYYVIEETFSNLEEYLAIMLIKGNFFFFGNGVISLTKSDINFKSNPLYDILSYIKFRKISTPQDYTPPILRAVDVISDRLTNSPKLADRNVFSGIILARIYANRAIMGHHISADMIITFRSINEEKIENVVKIFELYKQRYDNINEENGYYVFSDLVRDIKSALYPKAEIDRLIQEAKEIVEILRKKSRMF